MSSVYNIGVNVSDNKIFELAYVVNDSFNGE